MNKKILVVSILAVLMLVTISFATAVSSNTAPAKKKESPLFGIRTRLAIGERLKDLKENIKARFIAGRLFWIPISLIVRDGRFSPINPQYRLGTEKGYCTMCADPCTYVSGLIFCC